MDNTMRVSTAYPAGQWAKALHAAEHPDPAVRARAAERMRRWQDVIRGMADGTVAVGGRAPVAGLPPWVTLEVAHGGFATGRALAQVPPDLQERLAAKRAGVPAERAALFGYLLTDAGLEELRGLMRSGYRLEAPEGAALPVVAWLLDHGNGEAAAALVDELLPFAGRLRFTPKPHKAAVSIDPSLVHRQTAGDARDALGRRRPTARIAAMREALTVWNPFADELLGWWLESVGDDGRPGENVSDAWLERGRELAARYRTSAAEHRLCTKHRNPKQNLSILVSGLVAVVEGTELGARRRGLLRTAVESMVRRRGAPGESRHAALREMQAAEAARPTHAEIAGVVADRLAALPPEVGISDVAAVLVPVEAAESAAHPTVRAGTPIPAPLAHIVRRATAGTVGELVEHGLIGSSETLAALLPQLTARTFAAAFTDPELSALMAALYRAFRGRRSLLLLDLQHQVRINELPWVAALSEVRTGTVFTEAVDTLRQLGGLALSGFPGTQLPNRLVTELRSLSVSAGLELPWVEELAADIFMGVFSPKFLAAAKIAGGLLSGSLYERYYGIDYAGILATTEPERKRDGYTRVPVSFDMLCLARADLAGRRVGSVAANGMVIEQAQILTTHNLATLAGPCGVQPGEGWHALAVRAFEHVLRLSRRLGQPGRPLTVIKDLAYAWRQTVFFLSQPGAEPAAFSTAARRRLHEAGPGVAMLTPVLDGLDASVAGASFDAEGRAGDGRRLLGWSTGGHWLLPRRG